MTTTATAQSHLLSDQEMVSFIARGYHIVEPDFPVGFNEAICAEIAALPGNPGDGILDAVPKLHAVYAHPKVAGALTSILGADYQMSSHRHCHSNFPGTRSQAWHQDSTNERHHQIRTVLAMYYPQQVTADMGPTVLMPGSHFRNAPTDRMANYANLRDQVVVTCKPGTVAITHYDIWHAASRNSSEKTRYMLKFLFNRMSEPTAPSWNHTEEGDAWARQHMIDNVYMVSQSDHYTERGLRWGMWNHLTGKSAA